MRDSNHLLIAFFAVAGALALPAFAETVPQPVPIAAPAVAPAPQLPEASEVLAAWWQQHAANPVFNVQFVGQAAGQHAMVIRFSKEVGKTADPSQYIHVVDDGGREVPGTWTSGEIGSVLVRSGFKPGRYLVIIDPRLASPQGEALGALLHGPIFIQ